MQKQAHSPTGWRLLLALPPVPSAERCPFVPAQLQKKVA
jgi:hypothetical protein